MFFMFVLFLWCQYSVIFKKKVRKTFLNIASIYFLNHQNTTICSNILLLTVFASKLFEISNYIVLITHNGISIGFIK